MTIPNLITVFRFLLVPAVIWALVTDEVFWALAFFVTAGLSDAVDGFIARKFNQRSELGAYMDPMADKILLVSVFIALGLMKELPLWLVIGVVSRDALIVLAVLLSSIMSRPVAMKPLMISKANTTVQIVLAIIVLAELAFETVLGPLRPGLVILCGLLTVGSAAAYLVQWLRHMGHHEQA
ncbi:CDP-alcohol phosphatidyltransferase family protein [Aquamicrobium zhengzhouense]|uniref:CDP-diacylglycerol--glycerol-3-phosphate 3-phosphatidyltransferase n=1 Tax=Aquamicrobium zhengzhouense TaxID=2781738 RepID=A0ABS0SAI3_9HYPH|nr:CDP-alcohol phosphatidyltransferase family protein [Aquamicrobium zhengzhouense]MBI1620298.1 CDP-alcohol phosphatidyltransferase family protein [Aquamicrobium zhengzhouense]